MGDEQGTIPILLIEDNRTDVELTLDAFREARLMNPIHVSPGGRDALDYLFGRGSYIDRNAHPLPHLVLLDLKLPEVDGFEILRQAKSTPILRRLPIIVLTSSKEEGDQVLSYDYGANGYLVKPIAFQELLVTVRQVADHWLSLNIGPPINASLGSLMEE